MLGRWKIMEVGEIYSNWCQSHIRFLHFTPHCKKKKSIIHNDKHNIFKFYLKNREDNAETCRHKTVFNMFCTTITVIS